MTRQDRMKISAEATAMHVLDTLGGFKPLRGYIVIMLDVHLAAFARDEGWSSAEMTCMLGLAVDHYLLHEGK